MTELQASIEFSVELGKFYNVDLFQRGYYQVRVYIRTPPKAPMRVEASFPRNTGSHRGDCLFPASINNGVACSKTFQILYRNEDIALNDVVLFKVHMLVESTKIEEIIQRANLELCVDLHFTEEEITQADNEKLQCVSQRVLKLNFEAAKGIHHYVPVLFDYFHLATVCVKIHGSLIALHQPYVREERPGTGGPRQPRSSWLSKTADQSTLETVLFGNRPATTSQRSINQRLQYACQIHRNICHILLSAYESLQKSTMDLMRLLPAHQQLKIEHRDCHAKLEELCQILKTHTNEEDLLQVATTDIIQMCAENVLLWTQYLELFTLNEKVTVQLAKDHHNLRVKRFAEAFFTLETGKADILSCYEPSMHGRSDLANLVKVSPYFTNIPPLPVECAELDGDLNTIPIIFEDIYTDTQSEAIHLTDLDEIEIGISSQDDSSRRSGGSSARSGDSTSLHSTHSGESASSPKVKQKQKSKFIKNIKPNTFKRPSYYSITDSEEAVGIDARARTDASLIGYRKIDKMNSETYEVPTVQLGTLSPGSSASGSNRSSVASFELTSNNIISSGSMPDLTGDVSSQKNPVARSQSVEGSDLRRQRTKSSTKLVDKLFGKSSHRGSFTLPDTVDANVKFAEDPANINGLIAEDLPSGNSSDKASPSPEPSSPTKTGEKVLSKAELDILANTLSAALGESESEDNIMAIKAIHPDNGPKTVPSNEGLAKFERDHSDGNTVNGGEVASQSTNNVQNGNVASGAGTLGEAVEFTVSDELRVNSNAYLSGKCTVIELLKEEYHRTDIKTTGSIGSVSATEISQQNLSISNTISASTETSLHSSTLAAAVQSSSGNSPRENMLSSNNCNNCRIAQQSGKQFCPTCLTAQVSSKTQSSSNSNTNSKLYHAQSSSALALSKKESTTKGLHISSSSPELYALHEELKNPKLVAVVPDATINFVTAKEELRRTLRYQGHFYSDYPTQASTVPYFYELDEYPNNGLHFVICVHGLDGNSADLRLVRTYLEMALPGARMEFLMSERNQPDTFADFEIMTDRLVQEIVYHMQMYSINPDRISFIGHSLGNLIIRSALSRPELAHLLPKLHTLLSLSGPHLGTMYNNSGLVNMGMWFMQKLKKSGSLLQLSLKDASDPRQTFIYKLSKKPGLEHFKNILLVGSNQDRYVPYHSTRIELCRAALRDTSAAGSVYTEMVHNILQPLQAKEDLKVIRYDVYHALGNTANNLIGRAAHIAVLDSEIFIEKLMTVAVLKYFK